MIPSTALELVVFLAALGPGYLYIRVAERRANRPERSGLVEAVELVVLGAFASTIALLGVLALAGWAGVLHVHTLGRDPSAYLKLHPLRLFWLVAVALLLAYGLAYGTARVVHRHHSPTIRPGGTAWQFAFSENRPADHVVAVSVELRDGRVIQGVLAGTTTDADENREMCLLAPIAVRDGPEGQPQMLTDRFLLLRESDILAVSGRYLMGATPQHGRRRWKLRTPITKTTDPSASDPNHDLTPSSETRS